MFDIIILYLLLLGIPFVMVIGGIAVLLIKPSRNRFFGYRTELSMHSDEIWEFANRYMGKMWLLLGGIMFIVCFLILTIIYLVFNTINELLCLAIMIIQMILFFNTIFIIEKKVHKKYDDLRDEK